MHTEAEKKANKLYKRKLKQISFRFSIHEEKLYSDFIEKCKKYEMRPTTVIKDLIKEWTYFRV